MKITNQTVKILENFSTINNTIFIPASKTGTDGTLVQTGDSAKNNVVGQAVVDDVFGNDVCIADLGQFLSVLKSFSDPDVEFTPDRMIISQGPMSAEITSGDPSVARVFKQRLKSPEGIVSFTLKQADLKQIINLSTVLDLPHLKIYSEDNRLYLQILKRENESSNTTSLDMGEGTIPDNQVFYIQREKLRMIEGDYQVSIFLTPVKSSHFKSLTHNHLEYFIALAI
jgi:hypothetical protein